MRYLWIPVLFVACLMGGDSNGIMIAFWPALVAGGLAAGGGIAGGFLGQSSPPPAPGSSFLQNTDPLAGGVSSEAALGIGIFDPMILNQTAPFRNVASQIMGLPDGIMDADSKGNAVQLLTRASEKGLLNQFQQEVDAGRWEQGELFDYLINQPGFILSTYDIGKIKEHGIGDLDGYQVTKNRNGEKILSADAVGPETPLGDLFTGLRRTGTDLPSFIDAQIRFERVIPEMQAKQEALAQEVFQGRLDLQSAITDLTQDFSSLAQSGFTGIEDSVFASAMRDRHDQNIRDTTQGVLDMTGIGGYNPGEQLAKIRQEDLIFKDELPLNAAGQLLQFIAGAQAIQQPALDNANRSAMNREKQNVDAAAIAAQQYNAFANAATSTNINNADNFGGGLRDALQGAALGVYATGPGPAAPVVPSSPTGGQSGVQSGVPNFLNTSFNTVPPAGNTNPFSDIQINPFGG